MAIDDNTPYWICNTCKHVFRKSDLPNKTCPECGGASISRYPSMVAQAGTNNV